MEKDIIEEDSDVVEAYRFRDREDPSRFVDVQRTTDGTIHLGFPCYRADSHSVVEGDCEVFYDFSPPAAMALASVIERLAVTATGTKGVVN